LNQQEQQDFLLSTFREEIDNHVITLTRGLMSLEEGSEEFSAEQIETMRELMRSLHTIKGAARMLGFADITRVAHAMEEVVGHYRNGEHGKIDASIIDMLFEGIDTISELARGITRLNSDAPGTPTSELTQPESIQLLVKDLLESIGETPDSLHAPKPTIPVAPLPIIDENYTAVPIDSRSDPGGRVDTGRADETIRVRLDKLDSMINLAGELVINKLQNEEHLEELLNIVQTHRKRTKLLTQLRDFLIEQTPLEERSRLMGLTELFSFPNNDVANFSDYLVNFKAGKQNGTATIENKGGVLSSKAVQTMYDRLEELMTLDRELDRSLTEVVRERKRYNLTFETAANELRRNMLNIRMLPLDNLFSRFPRPVRDLAIERGKQVRLNVSGGNVEIDKRVLEEINDPLQHILRNAVDHGIERPDERHNKGKPAEGSITLSASQRGSHVYIQVTDDGRGLDPDLLRQVAVRKGLLNQLDSQLLTDEDTYDLIFRPGFSTRDMADEISGRGVGLDIVQQNVKRLNGRISVVSEKGKGTTITLEIPLTLATVDALLVKAAGQLFAIPSVMVEASLRPFRSELVTVDNKKALRLRDQLIPVVNLAQTLGMGDVQTSEDGERDEFDQEDRFPAVLLSATVGGSNIQDKGQERFICFEVAALVDEREVVVKALPRFLENVPNVAGATLLGADGLALILDVFGLVQTARQGSPVVISRAEEDNTPNFFQDGVGSQRSRRILVADDSLATRELERSILETAGYEVETARDGVEALNIARQRRFDLILTDVEMPNMDGFRLCTAIRQDEKLNSVPVVIVSSRDSEEDKRKGLQAGAQAYIVKSLFEQNNLLETIRRLVV
jgi:two-component system, chemotaxis family, sensor kinase CheA